MMQVQLWTEKLNKVDGNVYAIEEKAPLVSGVYEAPLGHDNINTATLAVYTGPKLTGKRIETYALSTPSLMPWKRTIRVYADTPVVYISYETDGDTVEAEDINRVQEEIAETQQAVNGEEARAKAAEEGIGKDLQEEADRAKAEDLRLGGSIDTETVRAEDAERALQNGLSEETARAGVEEKTLTDKLTEEVSRAKTAEKVNADNISGESERAKAAEKANGNSIAVEKSRAMASEGAIRDTIATNKPVWDNKYTRNEVDNKFSALETAIDWKEAVGTFADLATAYPDPEDGWTVNVKDTDYTYRWSGAAWVAISANAIPKATQGVDGLLSKEDKADYDDANRKKHTHANKGLLDGIARALLDNWNAAYTHVSNKSNPHGVTKSQVGLGSVPNVPTNDQAPTYTTAEKLENITSGEKLSLSLGKVRRAIADLISHLADKVSHITSAERTKWNTVTSKVDKVSGKQLSESDYTDAEKSKLAGIAAGAEVNVQPDWNVTDTGSDAFINNKPSTMPASDVEAWAKAINKPAYGWGEIGSKPSAFPPSAHEHTKDHITDMPVKVSEFDNDAGYITQKDVDTSQDHTHTNKAVLDKIAQSMLDKLAGIAAGANKYVHPTTAGNRHVPAGGSGGQILRWSADGSAAWGADNNTTYGDMKGATSSAAGSRGLAPAPAAGKQGRFLRGDGTWADPPSTSYTHPDSGVEAGTYKSVMVNAQGHVTGGTNPTTLAGYGIADAATKSHNHDNVYLKKGVVTWGDLKGV